MEQFKKIYEENKKMDKLFDLFNNESDNEMIEKNIVELLVEIGELANETRCFKYWSVKKSSPKNIILEEYADCFLMALYFCNMTNVKLSEKFQIIEEKNIVKQIKKLYILISKLECDLKKENVKEIFANLVNLGRILNFSDNDIIEGCLLKIDKNKKRMKTGY